MSAIREANVERARLIARREVAPTSWAWRNPYIPPVELAVGEEVAEYLGHALCVTKR